MFDTLTRKLRGFRSDERGYVNLEVMILLPVILWIFAASWVYFDAFRQQSVNQKASYTVGDMLSRETNYITPDYIDGTFELYKFLTRAEDGDVSMRITVVRWNDNNDRYQVVWSRTRGAVGGLVNNDVRNWTDRLPQMSHNEQVILVETWESYEPTFQVGLPMPQNMQTFSFTKPRFAPQIKFEADT